ncbi:restriction endonuclease subunit S [Corynebacterium glutamicum]|uniref:restriction endonuclease subunit S n=1 Tax=Corynebacterium glutamicum TaxID=1718 RepID=UPI000969C62A|nr:restriction endonuclease subunit S [Corynebacterium glutamicum]OKX88113.1 hypothetical protein AUO96_03745 [Corynebacterium glutamicum]
MSVVNWLGVIDRTWGLAPLFTLGSPKKTSNTGLIEKNLLSLSYGAIIRKDIDSSEGLVPASYETYQIVDPGDVVLRFTDLQNDQRSLRSGLVTERGIITSAYMSLTPNLDRVLPRFLAYMMRAIDINKVFYRMGSGVRQSLNWSEFSLMRIPLPPLETQQRIADYLDRETAEIDAAVADLDRYVELLEKRIASSALEVASELSARWPLIQAKFLIDITTGSGDTQDSDTDGAFPFYVRSDTIQRSADYEFDCDAVLTSGDGAGVGKIFHLVNGKFKAHQRVYVMRNFRSVTAPYFYWMFKTIFPDVVKHGGAKSTVDSVRLPMVANLKLPVPPLTIQSEVIKRLSQLDKDNRQLIDESKHLRELLLKRRSVLITEVVTGRKQV